MIYRLAYSYGTVTNNDCLRTAYGACVPACLPHSHYFIPLVGAALYRFDNSTPSVETGNLGPFK